MYLGKNLNRARNFGGDVLMTNEHGEALLLLDGRERNNPAAQRANGVPDGVYVVTKQEGRAPGDVRYWGEPV